MKRDAFTGGGCERENNIFWGGGLDKCHRRHNKGRFVQGHKGFLHLLSAVLDLVFLAKRIQQTILFPRRLYSRNLCTNDLLIVLQLLGIFCFVYLRVFIFVRKHPSSCDCAPRSELTSQRQKDSRLPTEPPGRREVRSTSYIILFCTALPHCLSGSIPKELGQLGALTKLFLLSNQLEGKREMSDKNISRSRETSFH